MKNVTKTNVLFTLTVATYMVLIFTVRLIPAGYLGLNARMVLPEAVLLFPAFFYVSYMKPQSLKNMSFRLPSISNMARIILITICLIPAISLITALSTIFVDNQAAQMMSVMLTNPLWLNIIIMALVPAVCEEYLFRGIIFHGYKERNPFRAMLLSGFLFALIHLNLSQFIYAFIMGFLFSLLVYATKTVMSSILAHFVFNAVNVMISYQNADTAIESVGAAPKVADYIIAYGMLLVFAVAGVYIAYKNFKKICEKNGYSSLKLVFAKINRNTYKEEEGKFIDSYLLLGVLMCVVYIVIYGVS